MARKGRILDMQIQEALRKLEEDVLGALRSENEQLRHGAMGILDRVLRRVKEEDDDDQ